MKKKISTLFLTCILVILVSSCAGTDSNPDPQVGDEDVIAENNDFDNGTFDKDSYPDNADSQDKDISVDSDELNTPNIGELGGPCDPEYDCKCKNGLVCLPNNSGSSESISFFSESCGDTSCQNPLDDSDAENPETDIEREDDDLKIDADVSDENNATDEEAIKPDDDQKAVCGNGILEVGETCDKNMILCTEINEDYFSGKAKCKDDCSGYDETNCMGGIVDDSTDYGPSMENCSGPWFVLPPENAEHCTAWDETGSNQIQFALNADGKTWFELAGWCSMACFTETTQIGTNTGNVDCAGVNSATGVYWHKKAGHLPATPDTMGCTHSGDHY